MLQKFALAVKTKTVEFFAEEEEEEEEVVATLDLDSREEIITGQRVVVIKPDKPNKPISPFSSLSHQNLQKSLLSSIFTTISSFHEWYLQLEAAHEPFNHESIESADKAAVSHLQRLSDIKKMYKDLPNSFNSVLPLSSESEAQVQENQSMLRMLETVFNRLQSEIDEKDTQVASLKQELREIEASNSLLRTRLSRLRTSVSNEEMKITFFSVGVFEDVLKESCKETRRFAMILIDQMKKSGWELDLISNSLYPNVNYAKRGHCRYALLSYICLDMFTGFGSDRFGSECDGHGPNGAKQDTPRRDLLGQFVDHLTVDVAKLFDEMPHRALAMFCENKYRKLIPPDLESSLFRELPWWDPVLHSWKSQNPLYEPFIAMCSSIWMLHKLALAFDRPVEIFQAAQGVDFSMIYMENVTREVGSKASCCTKVSPKVGFTVFPGFCVGSVVIQSKVYLNYI